MVIQSVEDTPVESNEEEGDEWSSVDPDEWIEDEDIF